MSTHFEIETLYGTVLKVQPPKTYQEPYDHDSQNKEIILTHQLQYRFIILQLSSPGNFCNIPDYIDGMVMYKYIAIL